MTARALPPPPEPPGDDHLARCRRDLLGFLGELAAHHGDLVGFRIGAQQLYLVSDPLLVRALFVDHADRLRKPAFLEESNRGHWGDGLTTLAGDAWRARRRLVKPAFQPAELAALAPAVVACTRELCETWRVGELVDVGAAMLALTARIAARTVLGAELAGHAAAARCPVAHVIPDPEALGETFTVGPEHGAPPFLRMARRRAGAALPATLKVIEARLADRVDHGDMLSKVARAGAGGRALAPHEVTGEVVQMMFAGHHTMSATLARLLAVLATQPDAARAVYAELGGLAGRACTAADLDALPRAHAVVQETMRLYPAAPLLYRELAAGVALGGHALARGALVLVSPYLLQRDPRWFPEPTRFRPDRFATPLAGPARWAYLPFGAGARACIGRAVAMTQLRLVLATLAQRVWLAVPGPAASAPPVESLGVLEVRRPVAGRCPRGLASAA